jgi:hypothetical protein
MTAKPPLPTGMFDRFPRMTVDETEGSPFREALRIAVFAADHWMLGLQGPYANPGMTGADVNRATLREGLLHLLELGFVDIDVERLMSAEGWPANRGSSR